MIEAIKSYKVDKARLENMKLRLEVTESDTERHDISEGIKTLSEHLNTLETALESLEAHEYELISDRYFENIPRRELVEKYDMKYYTLDRFRKKAVDRVAEQYGTIAR